MLITDHKSSVNAGAIAADIQVKIFSQKSTFLTGAQWVTSNWDNLAVELQNLIRFANSLSPEFKQAYPQGCAALSAFINSLENTPMIISGSYYHVKGNYNVETVNRQPLTLGQYLADLNSGQSPGYIIDAGGHNQYYITLNQFQLLEQYSKPVSVSSIDQAFQAFFSVLWS